MRKMSLGRIRVELEKWGFALTDEQFDNLTYRDLKRVFKKAQKISNLKAEIESITNQHETKTKKPAVTTVAAKK